MIRNADIWYDMDDVTADFFGFLANFGIVRDMSSDNATDVGAVMDILVPVGLYEILPPKRDFDLGLALARKLRAAGHNLGILSSCTARPDAEIIEGQKLKWNGKMIPDIGQIFNLGQKFARGSKEKWKTIKPGRPNILIDDFAGSGKPWQEHGGLWIQHTNFLETIKKLREHGVHF